MKYYMWAGVMFTLAGFTQSWFVGFVTAGIFLIFRFVIELDDESLQECDDSIEERLDD